MSKHEKIVHGQPRGEFDYRSREMTYPTLAFIGAVTAVLVKFLLDRSGQHRPRISSNLNRHQSLSNTFPSVTGNRRHK